MEEYHKLEAFPTEDAAFERIKEIKANGIPEYHIWVVSQQKEDAGMLNELANIQYKTVQGATREKFASLFSDKAVEEKVLDKFNISPEEKEQYIDRLNEGQLLVYIEDPDLEDSVSYLSAQPTLFDINQKSNEKKA
ncbi:general stress protein [Sediminibacillus halophilus]|uniref:Heat induced stress protein YflT n=1 Tax=Sediminibacillus halophilus TaxID=482461 RepID=A0A1G9S3C1_9BACI|nr:general stress protein [Sediminibacillus halophilus]SDM29922.1 Heat induced stress protein YflT [Sediminibacillus halophilus]